MGSGISQEEAPQKIDEGSSSKKPISQAYDENHTSQTNLTKSKSKSNELPHDFENILKDADSFVDKSSIDRIYDQLYLGVFLNQNRKKYWVEKATHSNCFLVFARDLSITWAEDKRYWHWSQFKETNDVFVDVAEMLNVCWLEIHGQFDTTKLTPGIKYEVVFVVMLKDPAYGWEVPVNVRLVLPNGSKQEHKVNMMEKPRGSWMEIPAGEFVVDTKNGRCIEFSVYEYVGGAWKRGLLVKGASIRSKN